MENTNIDTVIPYLEYNSENSNYIEWLNSNGLEAMPKAITIYSTAYLDYLGDSLTCPCDSVLVSYLSGSGYYNNRLLYQGSKYFISYNGTATRLAEFLSYCYNCNFQKMMLNMTIKNNIAYLKTLNTSTTSIVINCDISNWAQASGSIYCTVKNGDTGAQIASLYVDPVAKNGYTFTAKTYVKYYDKISNIYTLNGKNRSETIAGGGQPVCSVQIYLGADGTYDMGLSSYSKYNMPKFPKGTVSNYPGAIVDVGKVASGGAITNTGDFSEEEQKQYDNANKYQESRANSSRPATPTMGMDDRKQMEQDLGRAEDNRYDDYDDTTKDNDTDFTRVNMSTATDIYSSTDSTGQKTYFTKIYLLNAGLPLNIYFLEGKFAYLESGKIDENGKEYDITMRVIVGDYMRTHNPNNYMINGSVVTSWESVDRTPKMVMKKIASSQADYESKVSEGMGDVWNGGIPPVKSDENGSNIDPVLMAKYAEKYKNVDVMPAPPDLTGLNSAEAKIVQAMYDKAINEYINKQLAKNGGVRPIDPSDISSGGGVPADDVGWTDTDGDYNKGKPPVDSSGDYDVSKSNEEYYSKMLSKMNSMDEKLFNLALKTDSIKSTAEATKTTANNILTNTDVKSSTLATASSITSQNTTLSTINTNVNTVKSDTTALKTDTTTLKADTTAIKQDHVTINNNITNTYNKVINLGTNTDILAGKIDNMQTDLAGIEADTSIIIDNVSDVKADTDNIKINVVNLGVKIDDVGLDVKEIGDDMGQVADALKEQTPHLKIMADNAQYEIDYKKETSSDNKNYVMRKMEEYNQLYNLEKLGEYTSANGNKVDYYSGHYPQMRASGKYFFEYEKGVKIASSNAVAEDASTFRKEIKAMAENVSDKTESYVINANLDKNSEAYINLPQYVKDEIESFMSQITGVLSVKTIAKDLMGKRTETTEPLEEVIK